MKKFFQRISDWFLKHIEEIKTAYLVLVTAALLILILFIVLVVTMCNDLVEVVETRNMEIAEYKEEIHQITIERNMAQGALDSVIQDYEDSIPKQQYIDDIEYLESVILELRGEFERECNSNN